MQTWRDERLDAVARDLVVSPRVAPGAAVAVAVRAGAGWTVATGAAGTLAVHDDAAISPDTPFDLASVTKPFVATAAARAAAAGSLSLGAPLQALLPLVGGTASATVPFELLLAHRAGLEAHRELFAPLVEGRPVERDRALRVAASARRPSAHGPPPPEGFPPEYSDLGYLLAGAALEHTLDTPLDALVEREVLAPLGLGGVGSARKWLGSTADFVARVARTEDVPWRGGALAGMVHDENAWALAGHGLSGHAGLFGTAGAVARFGAAWLDAVAGRRGEWLSRRDALTLVRQRPAGTLRAGFDGRAASGSSAGETSSAGTFGHLGFTGTSLWCDPEADAAVVLLTNRVNPTRANVGIRAARPRVHDALFAWARSARPFDRTC
ncbi:MAG: serine hydrolase [Sorangiineae bacterium]|nr:serine hydrolase [Polyangiaceae bacterium]MEB2323379.1 serine hydrolase [Sorangiineae bacterium]